MATPAGVEGARFMADVAARLEQAVQHRIAGEYDEAVEILKDMLAQEPDLPDAHHELGLDYVFTGLFDESTAELEKAVELAPQSVKFLIDLGKTHTMLGDYEKAIPVFERVLEMDPSNDEAQKNLKFLR
jgi:tetratricopeptide (TPR) repeat protein